MNIFLVAVIAIILFDYLLHLVKDVLNIRKLNPDLPREFEGFYDEDSYKKSQQYLSQRTVFSLIEDAFLKSVTIIFILAGGFNAFDLFARSFKAGPIPTGMIFAAVVIAAFQFLNIPFSYYYTFVIEEKFGFNKTKRLTFFLDIAKSWFLGGVIAGVIYTLLIWFFRTAGNLAWAFCWIAVVLFQLFLTFIAPVVILPIFNKFTPLTDGPLKKSIEDYANKENFTIKGIYVMDGSRRSAKSNAFFTGFGKFKRIVLFDTLISKHTTEELVSIIAHEMGHFKMRHIHKMLTASILQTGFLFFLLSFFIKSPGLFSAFKMEHISVYAGIIFFSFLYAPIQMFLSILSNFVSRKFEYQADSYTVKTFGNRPAFICALRKLSSHNLSNLTPHKFKVFMDYTHPPVLERIKVISEASGG
ncbi:MAG: M48 family metallopeptidase [Candidatus Omnitrophota bacterium]